MSVDWVTELWLVVGDGKKGWMYLLSVSTAPSTATSRGTSPPVHRVNTQVGQGMSLRDLDASLHSI